MKFNIRKLKGYISRHKIALSVVLVALVGAISILTFSYFNNPNFSAPKIFKAKPTPKETRVPAPLTGELVDPSVAGKRPFAVVIENSTDARPQSGYPKADVVYETLAEGGITRTLAIFQSQEADEIGPVRSAREYFIDWLSEVNAIFSHVGGSAQALSDIAANNIPDLNQFSFGNFYWRSTSRYAPHNVYTTTSKLVDAAKSAGYSLLSDVKWYSFKDDLAQKDRPKSQKFSVNFSGPLYLASYEYDPSSNTYARSVAGVLQKDAKSGETIKTKNIIVQFESMQNVVNNGVQGVDMQTIGSGKALVFQDGKAIVGRWQKTSRNTLTALTDENGKEILLNRGQTWIEVVPQQAAVTY